MSNQNAEQIVIHKYRSRSRPNASNLALWEYQTQVREAWKERFIISTPCVWVKEMITGSEEGSNMNLVSCNGDAFSFDSNNANRSGNGASNNLIALSLGLRDLLK